MPTNNTTRVSVQAGYLIGARSAISRKFYTEGKPVAIKWLGQILASRLTLLSRSYAYTQRPPT